MTGAPLGFKEIDKRINNCSAPVGQTWKKIHKEDQKTWASFFAGYGEHVLGLPKEESLKLGGPLAYMFSLGHEYYRFYGALW
jgi:hypothetical protein